MKAHQMKLAWIIRYIRTGTYLEAIFRNVADLELFVATKAYIFLFLKKQNTAHTKWKESIT